MENFTLFLRESEVFPPIRHDQLDEESRGYMHRCGGPPANHRDRRQPPTGHPLGPLTEVTTYPSCEPLSGNQPGTVERPVCGPRRSLAALWSAELGGRVTGEPVLRSPEVDRTQDRP